MHRRTSPARRRARAALASSRARSDPRGPSRAAPAIDDRQARARHGGQARSVRISRANPFSEVTDRFCRLPLSALFVIGQRLLASETCCGRSVRARTRFNSTCPDFQGTTRRHRTTSGTDVAFRPRRPPLLRSTRFHGERISGDLTKKRELFPGSKAIVSGGACVTAWPSRRRREAPARKQIFVSRLGNRCPIPFRLARDWSGPRCVTALAVTLRRGYTTIDRRSRGTLLHFGLRGFRLNVCYYHQDLHRRPLQPSSRPGLLRDRRTRLLERAFVSSTHVRLARHVRRSTGPTLQRHPFSGPIDSAGESLHTPWRLPTSMATVLLSLPIDTFCGL